MFISNHEEFRILRSCFRHEILITVEKITFLLQKVYLSEKFVILLRSARFSKGSQNSLPRKGKTNERDDKLEKHTVSQRNTKLSLISNNLDFALFLINWILP